MGNVITNPYVRDIMGSKAAEELTKEYKKELKAVNVQLNYDIAHSNEPLERVIEFNLKKGKKSSIFSISSSERNFMYLKFWTEFNFVDVKDIIWYVQQIGRAAGYSVLFISSIEEKLEIPMEVVLSTPISEEDRTDRFFKGFVTEGDLLYVNLVENYMEDMLNIIRALEGEIKKQKEKNPSFSCSILHQGTDKLQYKYYVNGLYAIFHLTFGKEISFFDVEFGKNKVLSTSSDMESAFREMIEKAEIETKFPALLNPPKKHFTQFLKSKLTRDKGVIDRLFNSLMETIDPREIEEEFALNAENNYKEIDKEQHFVFIKLMGFHFVVNLHTSEVEKFDTYNLAYSYYGKTVLNKYNKDFLVATNNFKEKLNTLEKV